MSNKKNSEGYYDPTAYIAMTKIEQKEQSLSHLKKILNEICELSGYRLKGTVIFQDMRNGNTHRL